MSGQFLFSHVCIQEEIWRKAVDIYKISYLISMAIRQSITLNVFYVWFSPVFALVQPRYCSQVRNRQCVLVQIGHCVLVQTRHCVLVIFPVSLVFFYLRLYVSFLLSWFRHCHQHQSIFIVFINFILIPKVSPYIFFFL